MTHLVGLNADYTTLGLYPATLSGSSLTVVTKSVLVETVVGANHLFSDLSRSWNKRKGQPRSRVGFTVNVVGTLFLRICFADR